MEIFFEKSAKKAFMNLRHRRSGEGGQNRRPPPPIKMPPMIKIITKRYVFSV